MSQCYFRQVVSIAWSRMRWSSSDSPSPCSAYPGYFSDLSFYSGEEQSRFESLMEFSGNETNLNLWHDFMEPRISYEYDVTVSLNPSFSFPAVLSELWELRNTHAGNSKRRTVPWLGQCNQPLLCLLGEVVMPSITWKISHGFVIAHGNDGFMYTANSTMRRTYSSCQHPWRQEWKTVTHRVRWIGAHVNNTIIIIIAITIVIDIVKNQN